MEPREMQRAYTANTYRYPNEQFILGITLTIVFIVTLITASATACLSIVFVIGVLIFGYIASRSQHRALLANARLVSPKSTPEVLQLFNQAQDRLQVEPVQVFIVANNTLNAYTFGMDSPKAIVLHSSLFQLMDRDELQFIIGHELGHVDLGHTWLNTLIGGMAGIPSSFSAAAILELAFRGWNRACEYSADRAGVLACSNPDKAITSLVKLEAGGDARTQAGILRAIQRIESEDDELVNNLSELLATHPMIIKRIEQIREFTASNQYQRLQTLMNQNLG
jgi:Zn-dependent protease with chaperone function